MKTFSKTLLASLLISLFVLSPIFAKDFIDKNVVDNSEIIGQYEALSNNTYGPFSIKNIEWINSTTIQAFFTDGNSYITSNTFVDPTTGTSSTTTRIQAVSNCFANNYPLYLLGVPLLQQIGKLLITDS